jgi:hypothetical protein
MGDCHGMFILEQADIFHTYRKSIFYTGVALKKQKIVYDQGPIKKHFLMLRWLLLFTGIGALVAGCKTHSVALLGVLLAGGIASLVAAFIAFAAHRVGAVSYDQKGRESSLLILTKHTSGHAKASDQNDARNPNKP